MKSLITRKRSILKFVHLFILICLSRFLSYGIDLTSVNFSYKYDSEALVFFHYKLIRSDSTYKIIFQLELKDEGTNFSLKFYKQKGYRDLSLSANTGLELSLSQSIIVNQYIGEYTFKLDSSDLAVFEVLHIPSNKPHYYDIPLGDLINFEAPDFLVRSKNGYLIQNFVAFPDSLFWDGQPLFIYEYDEDFPPALPPLSTAPNIPKDLNMNSVTINDTGFKPDVGKFYFLQTDSSSYSGVSIVSAPPIYPRLIRIEDVIQPLVYISTKTEFDDIEYSQDKKKALDTFWLDITRSPERAAETIKYYFRQISNANQFFTNYKQGWKTDMGMVLIVFGSPDAVRRSATSESWIYDNTGGDDNILFTFNKIRNIFTPHHYELERTEELKRFWFQRVNQWRKGRI